jgi:hypothetical protein
VASLRATVLGLLEGDEALMGLLTGGVYDRPIDRDRTPGAFDREKGSRLKPCAVLTMETAAPTGPVSGLERAFFTVWVYQAAGYDRIDAALRQIKTALDERAQEDLGEDGYVYEFRHVESSADLQAQELNFAPCRYARFSAVTHI